MNALRQHNMSAMVSGDVNQCWKIVSTSSTLGWWEFRNGSGRFSDKVIKIPSRRGPDALRYILNDFEANADGNHFRLYVTQGEKYFYEFLNHWQTQQI
jgi:sulfite reductase (ferredoxin)